MVWDVGFGKGALKNDVSSGCEGTQESTGGASALTRPDLPGVFNGYGRDGSGLDVHNGTKEVGVWDNFQLGWFVIKPFLTKLLDGWRRGES